MASSLASSTPKSFKYHVFLSFHGKDTRKTFVDHLYASLKEKGIHTFRDNEKLEKGKRIDELFKAIKESRYFIIVFSKNYASSSWCLKEVTKIMECQDEIEQIAYPVFIDVEPSDIRKQSGPVEIAIAKHKTNKDFKEWEKALEDAGNLVGWDLKNIANGHEAEAIKIIVQKISLKLRSIHLSNDENLIGMERRMQVLESSLGIGLNSEARMIGIKGMGGIGKTTLARAIFNRISSQFDGATSFVENVREDSEKYGLQSLQQRLLSDVTNDKDISTVRSVDRGKEIMATNLPYIKVLIVLDDVDDLKQLEALAGRWFKDGSRIIITTRHDKLLLDHGVNKEWIHDVGVLSDGDAMSLFSRYAFQRHIPLEGYEKLSLDIVKYAVGLPLTIRVLGSDLRGKKVPVWIDKLAKLHKIPCKGTLEVLETCYTGLEDDQQQIFLDVACFMKGLREDVAIRILKSCGYYAIDGLSVLENKSLVTILNERLVMHDRIEDLGRDIVRRSHRYEPSKHTRLWDREEIEVLLSGEVEAEARCIRLDPVKLNPEIVMTGLGNLKKLRVLLISGRNDCSRSNWKFDQVKQYFPKDLRFLSWESYPARSLPETFRANNLVGLELPSSRITQLWESRDREKLENLKFLDLSDSKLRTLDLKMFPELERLDLEGCRDLRNLEVSAECLKRLVYLNLIGCLRFKSFVFVKGLETFGLLSLAKLEVTVDSLGEPPKYSHDSLPMLKFTCSYSEEVPTFIDNGLKFVSLNLKRSTKLESVAGSICGLRHLRHLTLYGCIPEVPKDLDQLTYLEKLDLVMEDISSLPDSLCELKHLKSLKVESCRKLEELPENLGLLVRLEELCLLSTGIRRLPNSICRLKCLEKLKMLSTHIQHLPDSICKLEHLKSLELESCRLLEKLPHDLGQLECLEKLILKECTSLRDIPNSICKMKRLRYFHLPICSRVERLPEGLGSLECLKELNIKFTGIKHLPQSISLREGLYIAGSESVLKSCAFATKIQTSDSETFCYIQARDNTSAGTGLGTDIERVTDNEYAEEPQLGQATTNDNQTHPTSVQPKVPRFLKVYSRRNKK